MEHKLDIYSAFRAHLLNTEGKQSNVAIKELLNSCLPEADWLNDVNISRLNAGAAGPEVKRRCELAISRYLSERGLTEEWLHKTYSSFLKPQISLGSVRYKELPELYRGVWLLAHYAALRLDHKKTAAPARNVRTALLVYGQDEKPGRSFNLLGPNTIFVGHARFLGNRVYLSGSEVMQYDESMFLIAKLAIVPQGDTIFLQHAIMMGAAFGEQEEGRPYATVAVLRKIPASLASPSEAINAMQRKRWTGYFHHKQIIDMKWSAGEVDQFLLKSIKELQVLSRQATVGDRIFLP